MYKCMVYNYAVGVTYCIDTNHVIAFQFFATLQIVGDSMSKSSGGALLFVTL